MPAAEAEVVWSQQDGYAACDERERHRSALSDVPKQSARMGFSHHHRQLRSRGGKHSPANLVGLTGSGTTGEHGWVHANPGHASVLGYMVPAHADPEEVPIYRLNAYGTGYGWHLQVGDQLEPCDPPSDFTPSEIADALAEFEKVRVDERRAANPFHL